MLGIGLGGWVVPSGMLEDAGQGHIPESLPRPRWVGQHMQAYPTTISVHTYKHTCKQTNYSPIIAYLHHCSALQCTDARYLTTNYRAEHRTQHAYLHSFLVTMCTELVLLIPNRIQQSEDQKTLNPHS